MTQDALLQTEQGIDPRHNRDKAWEFFEQLRDPSRGPGLDEEEFCGGRAEPGLPGGSHFPEARSPHPLDF